MTQNEPCHLATLPLLQNALVPHFIRVYNRHISFRDRLSFMAVWGGGEMADATDLKSVGGNSVWVRLPPALLFTLARYAGLFCWNF